jgi:ornithine cyclodeaminase/alanine dehydrogenase
MLILSDQDIAKLLTMEEAIIAVEQAFKEYANETVDMPDRSTIMIEKHNGSISLMPSYLQTAQVQATKIISIYPDNPRKNLPTTIAWIIVIDPETGMIRAFMDGTYVTALRTGAITGVAAKYLARKDAKTATVFGAGVQARTQVWAIKTVRDIEQVNVYDPIKATAKKFVSDMSKKHGIEVIQKDSAKEAVFGSDIIITATTSSQPVVKREWMDNKTHVSAIGAFYPNYRELDTATIADAKVVVDDLDAVMREAGDILIPLKEGAITKDHIYAELKDLVSGEKSGRLPGDGLTVFKTVGVAIQDASVAKMVLNKIE